MLIESGSFLTACEFVTINQLRGILMSRRERLMATIKGEVVDRPAVSFYELNGLDENPDDKNPFNIYSHPSWLPLIELTREKTDRIVMRGIAFEGRLPDPIDEIAEIEIFYKNASRFQIE